MNREDFNMAGVVDGYKYADQIPNRAELLARAINEGERFVRIYQHDIEQVSVRVAIEMIRIYALGFIDGVENTIPCPTKCVLSVDEEGHMVVHDLAHTMLFGDGNHHSV